MSHYILQPGEIRIERPDSTLATEVNSKPQIERPTNLVNKVYPEFQRRFNTQRGIKWVYYPCCGTDVSPSSFFDEVTYVDKDQKAVEALRQEGFRAYQADAREFKLEMEIDLMVLFSSHLNQVETKELVQRINPKIVLCNNPYQTAEHMQKIRTAKHRGVIDKIYHVFDFR